MARNKTVVLQKQKTFNIVNPIRRSKEDGMFDLSSTSMEKYKSNLHTLIFTGIGERIMLPEFGTRIPQLIFEPIDESVFTDIEDEIREKVKFWIPEIKIDSIEFRDIDSGIENNKISFKLNFSLRKDETVQDFIEIEMRV